MRSEELRYALHAWIDKSAAHGTVKKFDQNFYIDAPAACCVPKTKAAPNSQLERLSFYFNINMGTGSTSE